MNHDARQEAPGWTEHRLYWVAIAMLAAAIAALLCSLVYCGTLATPGESQSHGAHRSVSGANDGQKSRAMTTHGNGSAESSVNRSE